MATTTTNFGFDVPTSSDLVKNGATAISTLGQDIDTFLAGSPTSTAGKNKIINGDFSIWQRGTSFSSIASSAYAADRWTFGTIGDTVNVTRQAFTPADITAVGYGDAKNFLRMEVVSSNGSARMQQKIEDVQTLANQNVTVSFWAKANASVSLDIYFQQNFGSGGSTAVTSTVEAVTLTTSWARYSKTIAVPSVSGKTIGSSSFLSFELRETVASTNKIFDFWGVQVEAGTTPTPFQTATGTIQGELAACQRYYYRASIAATPSRLGIGLVGSTTSADLTIFYPVPMRTSPTALEQNGTATDYSVITSGNTITVCSAVPIFGNATTTQSQTTFTVASGLTAGQACLGRPVNTSAYLGWSAEL